MDIDSKAVNRRLHVKFLNTSACEIFKYISMGNCHYHLYAMRTEFIFALNQSQ